MKRVIYDFKDHPDHKARLPEWRDRWMANMASTKPMDDEERAICREAVMGLYAASGLAPPKHIVFVPSPFVLAFAGGFAAAMWHKHHAIAPTIDATIDAISAATSAATIDATSDAISAATRAATIDAIRATSAATRAATYAATIAATRDATSDAIREDWYDCNRQAIAAWAMATAGPDADLWFSCAASSWRMWTGGNQWSYWDAWISFFREVCGLELPEYESYRHWQALTEHSGPRIMHPDFCMVSDRPEVLLVNAEDQPHCTSGPFCRWRDGSKLYSVNGVRVPAWLVETPAEALDPARFAGIENAEVRREFVRKVGIERICSKLGTEVLDRQGDYELHMVPLGGETGEWPYLKMRNPSIDVWHMEAVAKECRTVEQALRFRNGGKFRHIAPMS